MTSQRKNRFSIISDNTFIFIQFDRMQTNDAGRVFSIFCLFDNNRRNYSVFSFMAVLILAVALFKATANFHIMQYIDKQLA